MDSRQWVAMLFKLIGKGNYFSPMMGFHFGPVTFAYPDR